MVFGNFVLVFDFDFDAAATIPGRLWFLVSHLCLVVVVVVVIPSVCCQHSSSCPKTYGLILDSGHIFLVFKLLAFVGASINFVTHVAATSASAAGNSAALKQL